jgi:hypothetical protein
MPVNAFGRAFGTVASLRRIESDQAKGPLIGHDGVAINDANFVRCDWFCACADCDQDHDREKDDAHEQGKRPATAALLR